MKSISIDFILNSIDFIIKLNDFTPNPNVVSIKAMEFMLKVIEFLIISYKKHTFNIVFSFNWQLHFAIYVPLLSSPVAHQSTASYWSKPLPMKYSVTHVQSHPKKASMFSILFCLHKASNSIFRCEPIMYPRFARILNLFFHVVVLFLQILS